MKRQKVLSIDYYDNFKCIGNRCEDHCCKDWGITIDKKTYTKYKKLQSSEFKSKLIDNIGRNRKSKSDYDYAKINLIDNKCPMLSEEGLCEIYQNIGQENMCHTCKTYPRSYNQVDDTVESSLTLSCIEVARNVLLRKNQIEFNLDIKEIENISINRNVNTIKSKSLREKCFNDIRVFSIGLIQDRRFTIEERLVILGLFIKNISNIDEENLVVETINQYNQNIESGAYNNLLENINLEKTIDAQLEFLTDIYRIILSKNINNKRYIENFVNIVNSLRLDSQNPGLIKERFTQSLDKYYNPFMKNYEYIYENYLVSYMFKTLFPISKMSLLDTYINIVVNFSIIKMNLIGVCGHYKEEMDTDKVLHLIQSFVKVVEHDNFIVDKLHKYLSENNLNTFAHMVILMGK